MKRVIRTWSLCALSLLAPVALAEGSAHAQPSSSGSIADAGSGGGGAGFGVGAAAFLAGAGGLGSGVAGPEVVFDQARYHLEGVLGFVSQKNSPAANAPTLTTLQFGVRAWYHLHRGSSSDFSLGGGVGLVTFSGNGNSATATTLEPGFQARVFLTPNFNLHATCGFSLSFGDNNNNVNRGVALSPQLIGGFGFTYFFR